MKSRIPSFLLGIALLSAAPAFAQTGETPHARATAAAGKLVPVTGKDAAWLAKARADYALTVCVASDEKLGSMGKSPEYKYRVAGQPDRLVILCCEGCEEDFTKEPAKYLAKMDAAAKAKSSGKKATKGQP